jgi:hypothetical protein
MVLFILWSEIWPCMLSESLEKYLNKMSESLDFLDEENIMHVRLEHEQPI